MEGVKSNTDEAESNTERVEPMVLVGALELCILIVIQIRDSGSSQMRVIDNQFILTVGTPRVKGIQEIDRWRHRVICQAPKNRLEATGSGKILQLGGRCGPLLLGCKLVQSDRWFWSPQPSLQLGVLRSPDQRGKVASVYPSRVISLFLFTPWKKFEKGVRYHS
jgi:hypothetical protein